MTRLKFNKKGMMLFYLVATITILSILHTTLNIHAYIASKILSILCIICLLIMNKYLPNNK